VQRHDFIAELHEMVEEFNAYLEMNEPDTEYETEEEWTIAFLLWGGLVDTDEGDELVTIN